MSLKIKSRNRDPLSPNFQDKLNNKNHYVHKLLSKDNALKELSILSVARKKSYFSPDLSKKNRTYKKKNSVLCNENLLQSDNAMDDNIALPEEEVAENNDPIQQIDVIQTPEEEVGFGCSKQFTPTSNCFRIQFSNFYSKSQQSYEYNRNIKGGRDF